MAIGDSEVVKIVKECSFSSPVLYKFWGRRINYMEAAKISVTRFGKIYPLWQMFLSL